MPMNAEDLRRLKHELRTPVNHIMGYSDLLFETAGDLGDNATADLAKTIHDSGQKLAKLLEKNLVLPSGDFDATQMDVLRDSIRPMIKHILDTLSSHSTVANEEMDDLDRIRRAADQLLVLVEGGRVPASQ
jgi:signal transduction histidine kinase